MRCAVGTVASGASKRRSLVGPASQNGVEGAVETARPRRAGPATVPRRSRCRCAGSIPICLCPATPTRGTPEPTWWPGSMSSWRAGGGRALVPTGIALAIPVGFAGFVQPRSGLALRHGVTCLNTPGLIDAGYRDELAVLLVNTDPDDRLRGATGRPDRPAGDPAGGGGRLRRGRRSCPAASAASAASDRRVDSGDGASDRPGRCVPVPGVAHRPSPHPRGPALRPGRGPAARTSSGSGTWWPAGCRWCPRSASGWSRCPSASSTPPWSTTPSSTSTSTSAGSAFPPRGARPAGRSGGRRGRRARSTDAGPCGSSTSSREWSTAESASIPKVHHAIIDGVSGAEVMAAFFDLWPDPAPRVRCSAPSAGGSGRAEGRVAAGSWRTRSRPGRSRLDARPAPRRRRPVARRAGSTAGAADSVVRTLTRTLQAARSLNGRQPRRSPGPFPRPPFTAPRTSINRAISPHRRVALAELPLADIRRVRRSAGRDGQRRGADGDRRRPCGSSSPSGTRRPTSSLVALVPVSVRTESERGRSGNRVSALLVSLATGVDDAATRLSQVRERHAGRRRSRRSRSGPTCSPGGPRRSCPALATRLTRLVTNVRLFDHLAPIFNLIVSNVPGPDVPLYLAGARMVAMYPSARSSRGSGSTSPCSPTWTPCTWASRPAGTWPPTSTPSPGACEESLGELVDQANRRDRPVPWWHSELPA